MHADAIRKSGACVVIDYTNHRGERSERLVYPRRDSFRFEATQYHPAPQHVFDAFDLVKFANRTFAMKDVHEWRPATDADFDRLGVS